MEGEMESDCEKWWREEGSRMRPLPGEDAEMHVKRIASIAWNNGAYKEREIICRQIARAK
jgi:hypothetical protein